MKEILEQLRKEGFRITQLRHGLLAFFTQHEKPCSAQELLLFLKKKKRIVNKTTVYREIEFLLSRGIIRELQLGDRKKYYEWNQDHHHHVICKGCNVVEDVELKALENILPKVERQLARKTRFAQIHHSLEFFGLCQSCVG
ncbi:MAG: Fur family transcriptional regulator [Candidatus Altimarinota bacterium]